MNASDLKKIWTRSYVGAAIYTLLDLSIRFEHGQGITEHIFSAMEYISLAYQPLVDSAMETTDAVKNGLSSKVNALFNRTDSKTALNAVEGTYGSIAYLHMVYLVMKRFR